MSSNKIQKSIGWSLFSEIAVKFVVPITNMILARVLTPDAFGVVAVCNMLISFVDFNTVCRVLENILFSTIFRK